MTRNNQSDNGDNGCDEQLPRPLVPLKEKCKECHYHADDTAYRLGTKVKDDASHETSKGNEKPLEGTV